MAGLTMDDVASATGLSKPALYYYFDSKEAVLRALTVRLVRNEARSLTAAVETAPPGRGLVAAFVRAYVEQHRHELERFRLAYVWPQLIGLSEAAVQDEINPEMIQLLGVLEQRIERDRTEGLLLSALPSRRLAFTLWASAHGLVSVLSVIDAGRTRLIHGTDDLVDALTRTFADGLYGVA